MGKHLKRLAAPRAWSIPKKSSKWVVKPAPGAHAIGHGLPLLLVVREYLKIAKTAHEARHILEGGNVLVDGKVVRTPAFVVGLMDVVTVKPTDQHYRVLYDRRGRIVLESIPAGNAGWKLCRIDDKTTVAGGKRQLNLHDGRNLVVKEDTFHTGDSLKIKLPEQKLVDHFPLKEGVAAYLTGGRHTGELATFVGEEKRLATAPNLAHLARGSGEKFSTIKDYVFVVGREEPEIKVPEVSVVG